MCWQTNSEAKKLCILVFAASCGVNSPTVGEFQAVLTLANTILGYLAFGSCELA